MSEEDIRQYLSRDKTQRSKVKFVPRAGSQEHASVSGRGTGHQYSGQAQATSSTPNHKQDDSFEVFSATHLYCPTCKKATPVAEKLLLWLSDGNLYQYSCTICHTAVGTRKT